MKKRKICVVTSTRAEYGLLRTLMRQINSDAAFDLQIVVAAAHLSNEHGLTYREIESDGFRIDERVEMLISSDSPVATCNSLGLGFVLFSGAYSRLRPDILVVLGDRYELLAAVGTALIHGIPIAHIHGGELTQGVFDEQIRHSISKMSHFHFVATEEYRKRVIQLGEDPSRVFNSGSPGMDDIYSAKLMSKRQFESHLGFSLGARNLLVTFHPVSSMRGDSCRQFAELLDALDKIRDVKLIFTYPNADPEGGALSVMIENYVRSNSEKAFSVVSMGRNCYLSAIRLCDAVVGNSSSGIIESPSFRKGSINIGSRQDGRTRAESVIDCEPERKSISFAIEKLFSREFQYKLRKVKNPYGGPGASKFIKNTLKKVKLDGILGKKFHDIV
jgi:GDP/UDP-N,N'-diacetylbacillosamine 2-epimerase (hydrolysing)